MFLSTALEEKAAPVLQVDYAVGIVTCHDQVHQTVRLHCPVWIIFRIYNFRTSSNDSGKICTVKYMMGQIFLPKYQHSTSRKASMTQVTGCLKWYAWKA